jgi:high affinity Mn2+ porin
MLANFEQTVIFFTFMISVFKVSAQQTDSAKEENWNIHFQQTLIGQYHPAFNAKYTGTNSLQPNAEHSESLTSTLFYDTRLWNGAQFIFNPELAGGTGLSKVLGVAGALNGETYRVGNPAPDLYFGRIYLRQLFSLSEDSEIIYDDLNQLQGKQPSSYLSVNIGKFSMEDFFDANSYSHDPRTDFFNWALMSGGAWDYPANTRGYTWGFVAELVHPSWSLRISSVMEPQVANGPYMDMNIAEAHSETIEYGRMYKINGKKGSFHILGFFNQAHMGSYKETLSDTIYHLDVTQTRSYAHQKGGFLINAEQQIGNHSGLFTRISWNDGQNETFVFTEIDQSVSGGYVLYGDSWKRKGDKVEIAFVVNGLSDVHKEYLAAGGYGFIIGDGALNYGNECILEANYLFQATKNLWFTPDYQFVLNPAYNKDRGPVHVFGLRVHLEY